MSIVATILGRPLAVSTMLKTDPVTGKGALVARQFQAEEAISQLFRATVDVVADKSFEFTFDQLLGTPVTVELAASQNRGTRYFHGICRRVSQSGSNGDQNQFRLELVPHVWLLTKRIQSRIFQQMSVDEILKKVLAGLPLTPTPAYDLGKFEQRNYCVQYHESDWNFAARLMEEEGIYFFFRHSDKGHQLVLANTPDSHKDVLFGPKITFKTISQAAAQDEDFISEFGKAQEITSGKVTLWDHTFELPHKHLEADQQVQESVQVGQATHKLKFGENGKLEVYNYPGEYAERFDGIAPGGVERPAELQKIFDDNKRTAAIRMQQQAASAVEIRGASTCRQLTPGYKFTLATQMGDPLSRGLKAEGSYVVTSVNQTAVMPDDQRSGKGENFRYSNTFTAIPLGLPFRPPQKTPKPVVPGSQTAVVCGPKGEEIFTDKYGRVKVQFHWDREGKCDGNSSCWVRVGTTWAGRRWGAVHIPRVGQEVIVDFLEGDPDRPIIVGSVFNADQMPPYKLPENKTRSGIKSNTSPGGQGFNEIRFEDKKGQEQVFVHAQNDLDVRVNSQSRTSVGGNCHLTVGGKDSKGNDIKSDNRELVFGNKDLHVKQNQTEWVEGTYKLTVGNGQGDGRPDRIVQVEEDDRLFVGGNKDLQVQGDRRVVIGGVDNRDVLNKAVTRILDDEHRRVMGTQHIEVDGSIRASAGVDYELMVKGNYSCNAKRIYFDPEEFVSIKADSISLFAEKQIHLLVGNGNYISIGPDGVDIGGTTVNVNGPPKGPFHAHALRRPTGYEPTDEPTGPEQIPYDHATPADPSPADNAFTGQKSSND